MTVADTLAEAQDIYVGLLKIIDDKKAWKDDEEKKNFHARVNHLLSKKEKHGQMNGKDKILTVDFADLDKLANIGLKAPTPISTTIPATPKTITKKVEPQPIVWLGRGYMGDAND